MGIPPCAENMPLEVVVEDLSDEPRALPEEESAATEAQTQGKKKNLALECSFEEESALSPGPGSSAASTF